MLLPMLVAGPLIDEILVADLTCALSLEDKLMVLLILYGFGIEEVEIKTFADAFEFVVNKLALSDLGCSSESFALIEELLNIEEKSVSCCC